MVFFGQFGIFTGCCLLQVQDGLNELSQHTRRPLWQPQTPLWCEQQPLCASCRADAPCCLSTLQEARSFTGSLSVNSVSAGADTTLKISRIPIDSFTNVICVNPMLCRCQVIGSRATAKYKIRI